VHIKKILLVTLITLAPLTTKAQLPSGGGGTGERIEKDFSFMPIPYISYNRSLGFIYGFLPMAMYNLSKNDTISPSSISGLLGMGTTNNTWFVMGFSKFFLDQDNYRITLAGGLGNLNFQFYPDLPSGPEYVEYSTETDFLFIEGQRKVAKNMYLGLRYTYINLATQVDIEGKPTEFTKLHGLGVVYSFDKRDNVYYPRKGFIANLSYNFFPSFLGNDLTSNKIELDYNQFFGTKNQKNVVGVRAFVGIGIGDLDFNQQFIVGQKDI